MLQYSQCFNKRCFIILLTLLIVSCNSPEKQRDPSIIKGETYIDEMRYNEALEIFTLYLKKDSTDLVALQDKVFCLMELNKMEESFKLLKNALLIDSLSPSLLINFGRYYLRQGDLEMAEKYDIKAVKIDPSYAIAYSNLGMIYGMEGKNELAMKYYNKSIEINPKYWGFYMNRGALYRMIGNYNLALLDLNKALNNDKSLVVKIHSFFLRGMVYRDQMEFKKSIDDFTSSINLKQDYQSLSDLNHYYRGLSYFAIKEYQLALKDLQEAKRLGWTENIDTIIKETEDQLDEKIGK